MTHRCHAERCAVAVEPRFFMCKLHWRMVPKPLRQLIWRLYRPGQEIDKQPSAEYLDAAREAIAAVAAKERPAPQLALGLEA